MKSKNVHNHNLLSLYIFFQFTKNFRFIIYALVNGDNLLGCVNCKIQLIPTYLHIIVSAELKMDVLREREEKDNLERQLHDEQKIRGK